MQTNKLFIGTFLIVAVCFTSCIKDFITPFNQNFSDEGRILTDPAFAEGLLLNAYRGLPNSYTFEETATDDAVSNVVGDHFSRMATGEWSSQFNPISIWDKAYTQIYYINYFLSIDDKVAWAWDDTRSPVAERNDMFRRRFKGEALALRAWYNFELLKCHGGIATDGKPTGFVILKTAVDKDFDFHIPRNSYDDCVQFILTDIDSAINLLPDVFSDHPGDNGYNLVFGTQNQNRVNGKFARALRSRVMLYAASQSFNNDPDKWQKAAVAAANLLTEIGGIPGLSPTGEKFWMNINDPEILFRRDYQTINSWEKDNFPPSLFGNGETNPSQNLVDAFPMKNGYPVSSGLSGYDPGNPYSDRDPRLKEFIIFKGNDFNGRVINTNVESATDGLNKTIHSTRTGYYLKKLLQPTTNISPSASTTTQHFYTIFRYTELFLNYAEAANEAWGPDADPNGYGFTPAGIIASIRKRAGISQPDDYLSSVSSSRESMRELIREERRIELCFEGFRFWDLRRWNLNLTEEVKGVSISNGIFNTIDVEDRAYKPFMNYGPVPKMEILKDHEILQNAGW